MSNDDSVILRLAALASALEEVARVTATADPVALSACEALLEAALSVVPSAVELAGITPSALAEQHRRLRHALERCRAVGQATTELIAASLAAQGVAPGYLPAGVGAPAPRLGRMEVRV